MLPSAAGVGNAASLTEKVPPAECTSSSPAVVSNQSAARKPVGPVTGHTVTTPSGTVLSVYTPDSLRRGRSSNLPMNKQPTSKEVKEPVPPVSNTAPTTPSSTPSRSAKSSVKAMSDGKISAEKSQLLASRLSRLLPKIALGAESKRTASPAAGPAAVPAAGPAAAPPGDTVNGKTAVNTKSSPPNDSITTVPRLRFRTNMISTSESEPDSPIIAQPRGRGTRRITIESDESEQEEATPAAATARAPSAVYRRSPGNYLSLIPELPLSAICYMRDTRV